MRRGGVHYKITIMSFLDLMIFSQVLNGNLRDVVRDTGQYIDTNQ